MKKILIVLFVFFLVGCKVPFGSKNYDTKTLGIEWIHIPAGEFQMGDNFNLGANDEKPVHTVYLDDYKISKHEVTFEMYDKFCEEKNRFKPDDKGWGRRNRPVINVSWDNARAFCDWLSEKTGKDIHLPTEAQWEKAARGTDKRKYPWANSEPTCSEANYYGCFEKTKAVGCHPSGVSPYGVHDMAGNVWEWCSDWYSSRYYANSPRNNPTGPGSGSGRVGRGGGWFSYPWSLRSTARFRFHPTYRSSNLGFRLAQD